MQEQGYGVDLHRESLKQAKVVLVGEGLDANHLPHSDVFDVPTPDQLGCPLPLRDAVIGNPPFVRYQEHTGEACKKSICRGAAPGRATKRLGFVVGGDPGPRLRFLEPEVTRSSRWRSQRRIGPA
jgi:hypothetical protein